VPASDAEANRCLDLIVDDGGAWYVGLSTTVPTRSGSDLTNVTDSGLPLVALPRDGAATWDAAVARRVMPTDALSLGVSAGAFVAVARVFWDGPDADTATPVRASRIAPITVSVGAPVTLPPASLALDHD
jgi:hypothetical protein